MKFDIKYRKIVDERGEYYLPDFGQFDEPKDGSNCADKEEILDIGKYGFLRLEYLREHKPVEYQRLYGHGELRRHLADVEAEAHSFFERVVPEMAKRRGITEQMKRNDSMKWVGMMNNVRACVDEIIFAEIIYV